MDEQEIKRQVKKDLIREQQKIQDAKFKAVLIFLGVGFVSIFFMGEVVWGFGILIYLGIWILYALAYGWQHFM